MSKQSSLSVEERVAKVCRDLGMSISTMGMRARFVEDFGIDSLDSWDLVMRLEEEFDIEISDEDAEGLKTPEAVVKYVEKGSAKS